MRAAAFLAAMTVLGACTGDRPAPAADGERGTGPDGRPTCNVSPGPPPEGFLLVRTREVRYPDRIAVREEYRHPDGRLLVYLLGVTGEMGEGAPVAREVELASGETATLFGTPEHRAWSLVWRGEFPCPQIAIVGNGFSRSEFTRAVRDARVTAEPG